MLKRVLLSSVLMVGVSAWGSEAGESLKSRLDLLSEEINRLQGSLDAAKKEVSALGWEPKHKTTGSTSSFAACLKLPSVDGKTAKAAAYVAAGVVTGLASRPLLDKAAAKVPSMFGRK